MSLVHAWSPLLLWLASWIGDAASAEKLVRRTWVRAVAQLGDFRPPSRLRVWLCRVLLEEARWLKKHLLADSYAKNFRRRLDNSTYLPLIEKVLEMKQLEEKAADDGCKASNGKSKLTRSGD